MADHLQGLQHLRYVLWLAEVERAGAGVRKTSHIGLGRSLAHRAAGCPVVDDQIVPMGPANEPYLYGRQPPRPPGGEHAPDVLGDPSQSRPQLDPGRFWVAGLREHVDQRVGVIPRISDWGGV